MTQRYSARGAWAIALAAIIAGLTCVYDYYTVSTGLQHGEGLIVVGGAALLMLGAALVMALHRGRGCFVQGFLVIAILLDIIGSSVAGYFLESPVIMAAEALALIGWLMQIIGNAAERSVEIDDVED